MSVLTSYDFNTPGDYTYNPLLIGVAAGASLLLQDLPGQNFTEDFASDVGFTYNASNTEFAAGVMRQIQKTYKPTYYLGSFFAGYDTSIDGDYGFGVLTGIATGGATILAGKLDLKYNDIRYVTYNAQFNASSQQQGCIRFKVTPNYSGSPAAIQTFIQIARADSDNRNMIYIRHAVSGNIEIGVYSSGGGPLVVYAPGAWVPVSGTEYEFEFNYNINAGPAASRFFINGTQLGATNSGNGTRDTNIGMLRVGSNLAGTGTSNFGINDLVVFDSVQHTVNFAVAPYGLAVPYQPTFYAGYGEDVDGDWGNGVLTGVASGGAAISAGKLDLNYNDLRYVNYTALNNISLQQTGCLRFKYTPNYSGTPAATMVMFAMNESSLLNNNELTLYHQTGTGELRFNQRNAAGVSQAGGGAVWNPILGTEYEIEFNYNLTTGKCRVFINGTLHSSDLVTTGTRGASTGHFCVGSNWQESTVSNFSIDDFLIFDYPQHITNYTPDWSDVRPYEYDGDVITLPEMEYTGVGTLISFDNFLTTEGNAPRYTLQIARSGNYLYWNGGAWAVSNNTYAQANPKATFLANLATLPILGEVYGQFRIYFQGNIGSQQSIDDLTASLTAQEYPSSEPTIVPTAPITCDALDNISGTVTGTGNVGFICEKDGTKYYHNGVAWVASDGSYAQSNTLAQIVTYKSTLMTAYTSFRVFIVLDSDGTQSAGITALNVYTNYAPAPVTVVERAVFVNTKDFTGDDVTACQIKIKLNKKAVEYNDETLIINQPIDITISAGYYDLELVETDSMEAETYYIIRVNGRVFYKTVPVGGAVNILDLPDYTG